MGAAGGVPVIWLLARASGLVAFGLLTLSVWLGLAMSTRLLGPKRQKAIFGWHRTLVWTALWKPVGVAAGVIAGWLTVVLALSFRAKRWIGHRGWRFLHFASFAAFVLFLGHALTVGTDLKGIRGLVLVAIAATPVIWLGLTRMLLPRGAARPAPPAVVAA
jgi:hypothetical protein